MNNTYHVSGITCDACVKLITLKVKKLAGVSDVIVDRNENRIDVIASRAINIDELQKSLAGTDYKISE